jgi:hypothetical protein
MPLVSQTFDQLLDFTRTTSGTFVGSNGLIQTTPASVNLLTWTQQFDNAAWTKTAATVAANSTVAPDGTSTADALLASAGTGLLPRVRATVPALASGGVYTASIYVRASTYTFFQIYLNNQAAEWANFTLTGAGTAIANGSSTADIQALSGGWYRVSMTYTAGGTDRDPFFMMAASGTATRAQAWNPTGTETVFIWGAQYEVGSTATTYTRNNGGVYPPRFDYDPVTLAPKGLLIEEQRTNLAAHSENFSSWSATSLTVTTNTTVAPDGTTTADTLTPSATGGVVSQGIGFTGDGTKSVSVFLKAGTSGTTLYFLRDTTAGVTRGTATITWTAGVPSAVASAGGTIEAVENYGNGWYRIELILVGVIAANVNQLRIQPDSVVGTDTVIAWGAQAENGAFATSYIPTVASQVTRAADQCSIVAPNFAPWYNQSEGTFVADISLNNAPATATFSLYTVSDNTNNERIYVGTGSGGFGNINTVVTDGGVLQAQTINSGLTSAGTYKYANAYKANDFASVANGGVAATDTSGTVPTVDRLFIGLSAAGAVPINGHIRSLRYYPTRLSDAQLQALTA